MQEKDGSLKAFDMIYGMGTNHWNRCTQSYTMASDNDASFSSNLEIQNEERTWLWNIKFIRDFYEELTMFDIFYSNIPTSEGPDCMRWRLKQIWCVFKFWGV